MSDDVTVIQADREAAAKADVARWLDYATLVHAGSANDVSRVNTLAVAFAKHRLSTPSPDSGERMREAILRAAKAIETLEITSVTAEHAGAANGKELIRAKAFARRIIAALQESAR